MSVKPISPNEVQEVVNAALPDGVIEAFNELIAENWSAPSKQAKVTQNEAIERILSKMDVERQAIFDKNWLDVEPLFRKEGWIVKFDKPGYCETYEGYFVFSRGKLAT